MASFKVTIELGNEAMESGDDVADALRSVASRVENGQRDGYVRDRNGNTVGSFKFTSGRNSRR